jgi:GNAT superfamily N-acetyltransferase
MGNIVALPWDTDFLGHSIGRLVVSEEQVGLQDLDKALEQARMSHIECLYVEISFSQLKLLEYCSSNQFLLVDFKTTLSKPIDPVKPQVQNNRICYKPFEHYFVDLIPIVDLLSRKSRFSLDPHFGYAKSQELYREWFRKSFYEGYCQHFLTYLRDDRPVGFATLKTKERVGFIDLLGVSESEQGKGIGSALIQSVEQQAASMGFSVVKIVTQGHNIAALRTYQRAGYMTDSVSVFYHKWLT